MSRLILIRHAQSVADVMVETMRRDSLYQPLQESLRHGLITEETQVIARELHRRHRLPCGINDIELTPEGVRQISGLSRLLVATDTHPKSIWCSPLKRTRATFEHLNVLCPDFSRAVITFDVRLIERQRGSAAAEFADLKLYLASNPRELARKKQLPPLRYAPPEGESLHDVQVRVALVMQEILAELRYGDALIVTHHSVINSLRSQLEKWPESDFLTKLTGDKPPNCGVLVYNLTGDAVSFVSHSW